MLKNLYLKLALDHLRGNHRFQIPCLIASALTVQMFYIVSSLSHNPDVRQMRGGRSVEALLNLGLIVVAIFALIFLFYTHSFLLRQRKKEFGLYSVLGLGKIHLVRILFWEILISLCLALLLGLASGIIFEKLFYLILIRLVKGTVLTGFAVSWPSIQLILVLFPSIYFLIFLYSVSQIHLARPTQLLSGEKFGEKELPLNWLFGLVGLACLGGGYYLALATVNPVDAMVFFFLAVLLVILGTFLLFNCLSIYLLKLLKKIPAVYYTPKNMINISNMIFRMKQNASGLASICILSTMVLVTLSSTFSMWAGSEEMIQNRMPKDYNLTLVSQKSNLLEKETYQKTCQQIERQMGQTGLSRENTLVYRCFSLVGQWRDGEIQPQAFIDPRKGDFQKLCYFTFLEQEDYNRLTGETLALNPDEVRLCGSPSKGLKGLETTSAALRIGSGSYGFQKIDRIPSLQREPEALLYSPVVVVVASDQVLSSLLDDFLAGSLDVSQPFLFYGFDSADPDAALSVSTSSLEESISKEITPLLSGAGGFRLKILDKKTERREFYDPIFGSLLFIGGLLSGLFLLATIVILYYKQITEGYQDQRRFSMMKKLGLERKTVDQIIRSQVLTVFYLPLVVAGIHIAFAFPMIQRILSVLSLTNRELFLYATLTCLGVFALIYSLVYGLTAGSYYKIVWRQNA